MKTRMIIVLTLCLLVVSGCGETSTNELLSDNISPSSADKEKPKVYPGMVWIDGGSFMMGAENTLARDNEKPPHPVEVDGFWMDVTPVTNDQFTIFVEETGYKTIAERVPTWEELKKQLPPGTPKPDESVFVAGSMVFFPSEGPVDLRDMSKFWRWVPGANWRHPEGPGSDIKERGDHPVVQIAWEDSVAYAKWAGKRLPTEAEWEFAARGGNSSTYYWGDEFKVDDKFMCNTWTGKFPFKNTKADGFVRTAPVKSFEPNNFGLYGMAGNVWNWCSDYYRHDIYADRDQEVCCLNPTGPVNHSRNEIGIRRVVKGGSFLCHIDYCASYRPSARRGQAIDTGMSHIGFRCVVSATD